MKRFLLTATAALSLAPLGACGDGAAPNATTGQVSLQLTDAPFPFDAVARADIYVVRVDARTADPEDDDASDAAETAGNADPRKGWVTVATPSRAFNLLELQNGATSVLGQTSLPVGEYRGFRLILDTDRSSITLKDGTTLNGSSTPSIKWPSAGKTGIKVILDRPLSVTPSGVVLVIDFDLGRSFVVRGNTIRNNGLLFKPVIKGVVRDVSGAMGGTVRGGTAAGPVLAGASIEVLRSGTPLTNTDAANVVATTQTDASGGYTVAFLAPGAYEVRATPPSGSAYAAAQVTSAVTTGAAARADIIAPARP